MVNSKVLLTNVFLILLIIIAFRIPIAAEDKTVLDEIAKDFKPLSGYLVKKVEGEYIIDLDTSHGIISGDLFSVIKRDEKLIHPVSKKVIGTLEQAKGVLRITRIKSGYSYARPFKKDMDFSIGDSVRRYENLRVVFWDYTEHGRAFFGQLQSALPDLKWLDYDVAQRTRPQKPILPSDNDIALFFIMSQQGIEARNFQFYRLHDYHLPESISGTIKPSEEDVSATSHLAPAPPRQASGPSVIGTFDKNLTKGLRYQTTQEHTHAVGELPSISIMSDFVKFGGKILMATTDGTDITILNVSQNVTPIAAWKSIYPGQILALKWWCPSEMEPIYLSVLIWSDNEVLSTLFRLNEKRLVPVIKRIPRILGAFDVDGDRQPETLFAQEFDKEDFFGRRIKQVKLIDGKVRYTPAPMKLPQRFTVLGSHIANLVGGDNPETMFIRSGILYIYSGKKRIYASPKQMGGSISFLKYDIDPNAKNVRTTSTAFEISPITMDLDNDGKIELIAVASGTSFLHAAGITPDVKKSWLAVVKSDNGRFHLGALGNALASPIQGLATFDQQVYLVISERGSNSWKGSKSYLLVYPIAS
jgi:hypothetical protein